ncbi:MAG TPA: site-2 protease family protein [Pseudothermotoga sp.]|nr:site-2 protease family protein [Pseudothermotoga sp.]HOK82736.1 site-2 protease family protein [Pseudothermotoga sp.]HPP70826.1 site-2 protease family protein [Pseudothermotoga sp.]
MSVVYFIVILIGIITVHEFGHFIFARIFGVDVLEFAIGFGPKLYERRGKKTSFRINVVPVGGYVKLAGEDPTEEQKEGIVGLYSKPAWQRLLIFFAGPLFSVLAGYMLFVIIVAFWGVPSVSIALVEKNSPAFEAGLQADDVILSINGRHVYDTYTVSQIIRQGKPLRILISRNGKRLTIAATPRLFNGNHFLVLRDVSGDVGEKILSISGKPLESAVLNSLLNQYVSVEFESNTLRGVLKQYQYDQPRYALGFYFATVSNVFRKDIGPFLKGDRLISIEGVQIQSNVDLSRIYQLISAGDGGVYIEASGDQVTWAHSGFPQEIVVEIERGNERFSMVVQSTLVRQVLESAGVFETKAANIKFNNVVEMVYVAFDRCNNLLVMMYRSLLGIFKSSEQGGVVGPLGLVGLVGEAAQVGLEQVLTLVAFITMSIGLFNLLPLPALDGGRIVFSLLEIVLRKRIDPKVEGLIHLIGFIVLMIFMIFVTFSDVGRLIAK